MASSTRVCNASGCKRPCRALCMCCQKYLCLDHLKEHEDVTNAQLSPLADQINVLTDQFNHSASLEPSGLAELQKWREDAHGKVDQFFEKKTGELQQLVQEKKQRQKSDLDRIRHNVNELMCEQQATQEQISSISDYVRFIEHDITNLQQIRCNITPLVIDDNFITITQDKTSPNRASDRLQYQNMESTSASRINKDNQASGQSKRGLSLTERFIPNSVKRTRWEIEEQAPAITDTMRVDILNIVGTSIETHGPTEIQRIAADIKTWLDETYGKRWTVHLVDTHRCQLPNIRITVSQYLKVHETRLGWTFLIFKEKS